MITISDNRYPISLTSLNESDRDWFYEVATTSYGGKYWYGPITGFIPPSQVQFSKDYGPGYFDKNLKQSGQCFAIILNSKRIGVIIYHAVMEHKKRLLTELDILIAEKQDMNTGNGSSAIQILCAYIFNNNLAQGIQLTVPVENVRAYYAYKKANFKDVQRIVKAGKIWMKMELSS